MFCTAQGLSRNVTSAAVGLGFIKKGGFRDGCAQIAAQVGGTFRLKPIRYLGTLLRFAFKENPWLALSVFMGLVSAVLEIAAVVCLPALFATLAGPGSSASGLAARTLAQLGIPASPVMLIYIALGLMAMSILAELAERALSIHFTRRLMVQLGDRAFSEIVYRLPLSKVSERSVGYYVKLAGEEASRASYLVDAFMALVSRFVLMAAYFTALAVYSPKSAVAVTLFGLVCLFWVGYVAQRSHRLGVMQSESSRSAASVFLETLNNLRMVRALSSEGFVTSTYATRLAKHTRVLFRVNQLQASTPLVPALLLVLLAAIWLVASSSSLAEIGIPHIVTVMLLLMRLLPKAAQAIRLLLKIAADAIAGKDVVGMAKGTSHVQTGTFSSDRQVSIILVRDAGLKYGGGGFAFRHVNLQFERGRSYAISGPSGIGKSSLVQAMVKLIPFSEGEICVDGVALPQWSAAGLRERVLLVGQDSALFNDSVRNNLCMGAAIDPAVLSAACADACFDSIVAELKGGLEAGIGYQGGNLSGGQRQRLALARALARDPDVLILDESTNALDKAMQEQIIRNILRRYRERIVIFITHDPAVAAMADVTIDFEGLGVGMREP